MTIPDPIDLLAIEPREKVPVCTVRLTTSTWGDKRGIHQRKSLTYLRRRSGPDNFLEEDVSMIGADEVLGNFVNLHECADGIYEVFTCNESTDWETGHVDDYDYRLSPITGV